MSDDGSEQDIVVEVKEDPGKKFFLAHMNTYTGKALLKELRNEHLVKEEYAAHSFVGTFQDEYDENQRLLKKVKPEGVNELVSMDRTKEFRDTILQSDVIVYDLLTNQFEEVDYVIKTLKTSELTNEKTLILLSSVMTWVNTPPKFEKELEDGEEPADDDQDEP